VPDTASLVLHSVCVTVCVTLLFYGLDALHLTVALTCAVLLARDRAHAPPPARAPHRIAPTPVGAA